MFAAQEGLKDIVKMLLNNGADPNAQGSLGDTALMYAAWYGHKDIAKILIDAGANVNAKARHDEPAIIWAGRGLDWNPSNFYYKYTKTEDKKEIIKMLKEAGAH